MLGTIEIVLVTEDAVRVSLVSKAALDVQLVMRASVFRRTYQMLMLGRGIEGRRMVPEKRLSRWGS